MKANIVSGLFLFLITGMASAVETAQPICLKQVPSTTTMTIDGARAGDWDTFTPQSIGYSNDAGGNSSTRFAVDGTYLYFYTEVVTELSAPQSQSFLIGVDAAGGEKMVQIRPFQNADVAPLSGTLVSPVLTAINPGSWTAWADPVPPNSDFHRILTNSPSPRWQLEGRVTLAHIGIADTDNADIFLYINASTGGNIERYWPGQGGGFVDIATPASLTFGANRCPDIGFTEPFLNFGKNIRTASTDQSFQIENSGAAGSSLNISSVAMAGGSSPYLTVLSATKDGVGSSPPFSLAVGETATVFVRYNPASNSSTLASPHQGTVEVNSNDPDTPVAGINVEGNARNYIDSVFILDQSGSMINSGSTKWVTTEWATEISAEVLRIFSLPQDRLGLIGFGGVYGSPQSFVLRPLTTFPASPQSYTNSIANADEFYWTPIGYGIDEAHDMFSNDSRGHVAVLMSDGIHNQPSVTEGATTVEGLNLAFAVSSNSKSMRIHTVALGEEGSVSTVLLDDIRDHYNPLGAVLTPSSTYNISLEPEKLAEYFIEPLMEQLIVNHIDYDNGVTGYPVEQDAHKVLALVAWQRGAVPSDIKVQVYDDTGAGVPITTYDSGTSGYYKGPDANRPYTYILIDEPDDLAENRVWKITDTADNPIAPPVGYPFVLVDLNIKALFNVRQQAQGTGNDIILEAKLTEVGTPLSNTAAHPVTVEASISRPDEGFGTFVSTYDQDCRPVSPSLPNYDPPKTDLKASHNDVNMHGGFAISLPDTFDSSQYGSDTPSARFIKAAALFKACDKPGLLRVELPKMALYDDGTHGDVTADDGVYTLRFTNTEYEGSYVVRFHVKGTTPSGAKFTRVRTLSEHLSVDVDPNFTVFDSRILFQAGNIITQEYFVIPKDRFSGYLGPGYPAQIDFATSGGQWLTKVVDYNNGIYSRILRYDERQGKPEVTVSVQGSPIDGGQQQDCVIPWHYCLWLILILLLIIALLLLWCRRRCYKRC